MTGKSAAMQTPDELLGSTVKGIEAVFAEELLNRVIKAPPAFFETVIVKLLLAMGYGGSQTMPGESLNNLKMVGIDGVIDQDALGLGGSMYRRRGMR